MKFPIQRARNKVSTNANFQRTIARLVETMGPVVVACVDSHEVAFGLEAHCCVDDKPLRPALKVGQRLINDSRPRFKSRRRGTDAEIWMHEGHPEALAAVQRNHVLHMTRRLSRKRIGSWKCPNVKMLKSRNGANVGSGLEIPDHEPC